VADGAYYGVDARYDGNMVERKFGAVMPTTGKTESEFQRRIVMLYTFCHLPANPTTLLNIQITSMCRASVVTSSDSNQKAYETGITNSVIGRIRQKSEDPDQAHRYLGLERPERFALALSDVEGIERKILPAHVTKIENLSRPKIPLSSRYFDLYCAYLESTIESNFPSTWPSKRLDNASETQHSENLAPFEKSREFE